MSGEVSGEVSGEQVRESKADGAEREDDRPFPSAWFGCLSGKQDTEPPFRTVSSSVVQLREIWPRRVVTPP